MAYSTTTRLTLLGRCRERLLATFWSDTELNLYIVEALRIWNALTGTSFSGTDDPTVSIPSGTIFTDGSTWTTTLLYVQRVAIADATLDAVDLFELDNINPTWQSDAAGTIQNYNISGLGHVTLYPKPTSTVDVYPTMVLTAQVPAADGDYIQIGEHDIDAIIDYVAFVARLKEGGSETVEAGRLLQNFLKQAGSKNASLNKCSAYRRLLGLPMAGQMNRRPEPLERMGPR